MNALSRSWSIPLREATARPCVWSGVVSELETAGHDVEWWGNWPQDPGDEEILAYARREARVLVTLDKDFGKIAAVQGVRHNGILRIVDFSVRQQSAVNIRTRPLWFTLV